MSIGSFTEFRTSINDVIWPAIPDSRASIILTIQSQLDQSQWWSPDKLRGYQFKQLAQLHSHCIQTVPFYQERFQGIGIVSGGTVKEELWQQLPVLTREEVQSQSELLISKQIPKQHGRVNKIQTSGSTGRPVTVYRTEVTKLFWNACTLRDHYWHQRDLNGLFCAIRPEGTLKPGQSASLPSWGPATDSVHDTGPSRLMNSRTDIATQAKWLTEQDPVYLLSMPSNLIALARCFEKKGLSLPSLREVRSYAEVVSVELRQVCRDVWGVPVKDMYSASEVGYMALQCPEHEHYHVQSETILFEVLDTNGSPCGPGETGRVVVTPLHNFAMPLIRYELGDYAEVGEPCPCGRGLPVIKRILGRQRNMLVLPDGRQLWPSFPAELFTDVAPIRQFQLVQKDRENIEVCVVAERKLESDEEKMFSRKLQERFGYPFVITINYVDEVKRSPSGKFEDFISEVTMT